MTFGPYRPALVNPAFAQKEHMAVETNAKELVQIPWGWEQYKLPHLRIFWNGIDKTIICTKF